MEAQSVIHIGAQKTGSTSLQRWLFSKARTINYLGEDCVDYDSIKPILISLVSHDDLFYDPAATRTLFRERFSDDRRPVNLYSNEDIMLSPTPSLCARRLAELLPDATILMVIRNQLTAVPSWYANHGAYLRNVPRYYWRRYVSLPDWMAYCLQFVEHSPLASFFYKRHADLWAGYFGRERVKILLFEDFKSNKIKFFNELGPQIGVAPKEAMEMLSNKFERKRYTRRRHYFHKLHSRLLRDSRLGRISLGEYTEDKLTPFLDRGPKFDNFMDKKWNQTIIDLYEKDNRALAHEFDLDLAQYGYPIR